MSNCRLSHLDPRPSRFDAWTWACRAAWHEWHGMDGMAWNERMRMHEMAWNDMAWHGLQTVYMAHECMSCTMTHIEFYNLRGRWIARMSQELFAWRRLCIPFMRPSTHGLCIELSLAWATLSQDSGLYEVFMVSYCMHAHVHDELCCFCFCVVLFWSLSLMWKFFACCLRVWNEVSRMK